MTSISDLRVFLGIWAGIFAVFLFSGILLHDIYRIWAIIGLGVALALQVYPKVSTPLYIAQVKLGSVIGWCISRATLVVLFALVFVPLGLIFRIIGRNVLGARLDKENDSYLISRQKQPVSMKNQF
ncbi:hypothetical protein [Helicobacter bilis]|uniref:hypothetical protein n=1 Tax=Helicobacter bilis TaxID=37372 RepID=UPI0026F07128|nr:hypothetical protein [Helicobacter bilis]MCI7411651.1 hypothetical protein [Helicobacter bilis]MDD7296682.1 hypothetical protein [Helicobacter bilis]MDY4400016.1 hypothetical protein [Helicobacter bilis]